MSATACQIFDADHEKSYSIAAPYGYHCSVNDQVLGRVVTAGEDLYIGIMDCTSCPSGFVLSEQYINPTESDIGCGYPITLCCSDNVGQTCGTVGWQYYSEGVEAYYNQGTYNCDGECKQTVSQYRCAAQWYGSGNSCNPCPSATSFYAGASGTTVPSISNNYVSSETGTTSIYDCYVRSGTYHDTYGTFRYATDCMYGMSGWTYTKVTSDSGTMAHGTTTYNFRAFCKTSNSLPSYQPFPNQGGTWCWCFDNNGNNSYTLYGNTSNSTDCTASCIDYCGNRLSSSAAARQNLGWE